MIIDSNLIPLLNAAESGNCHALSELSERFLLGIGVPKSRSKARFYLQRLADLDKIPEDFARFDLMLLALGDLYHADKNYRTSLHYYQKAKDYILATYPPEQASEILIEQRVESEIRGCLP